MLVRRRVIPSLEQQNGEVMAYLSTMQGLVLVLNKYNVLPELLRYTLPYVPASLTPDVTVAATTVLLEPLIGSKH